MLDLGLATFESRATWAEREQRGSPSACQFRYAVHCKTLKQSFGSWNARAAGRLEILDAFGMGYWFLTGTRYLIWCRWLFYCRYCITEGDGHELATSYGRPLRRDGLLLRVGLYLDGHEQASSDYERAMRRHPSRGDFRVSSRSFF